MDLSNITLIVGLDGPHLKELRRTWPTWRQFKPDILQMPTVVFFDPTQVDPREASFLNEHPLIRWIPWRLEAARNQREKMISGFFHIAAREVSTPWYLKLDTDTVATGPGNWLQDQWFEKDASGKLPVFIAPRWSYTKPRYALDVLDDWADGVPELARFPRLNIGYNSNSRRVRSKRIISWFFLGQTDWTKGLLPWLDPGGRLPVPSHDTFLYYCAARRKERVIRLKMEATGFAHWRSRRIAKTLNTCADEEVKIVPRPLPSEAAPQRKEFDRGVIYYHSGTSCAVRMLVSLASLRKFYSGSVTIISVGPESLPYCRKIGGALGADVVTWEPDIPKGKNSILLGKTCLQLATPYLHSLMIDADTLVRGPVDELLDLVAECDFVVPRMANWSTKGRTIKARIAAWKQWVPDAVEPAIAFGAAVNTGVMAFHKRSSLLHEWIGLAILGRERFIPDEISCQLLLPRHPHRIVDARWNCSCRFGNPTHPDVRIIHYHGRKHCRPGLPFGGELWVAAFEEVLRDNVAGIREWMPSGDRMLKRFLKMRRAPEFPAITTVGPNVHAPLAELAAGSIGYFPAPTIQRV
jgi:hypothetical protein